MEWIYCNRYGQITGVGDTYPALTKLAESLPMAAFPPFLKLEKKS
jgi:hypothetical protein